MPPALRPVDHRVRAQHGRELTPAWVRIATHARWKICTFDICCDQYAAALDCIERISTGRQKMQLGDHLVTPRLGYTHHGIFVGDDSVIHYSGFSNGISSGVIDVTSFEDFCNGKGVEVRTYENRKYSPEESVERAYSRLGEDWYNVLLNNCEQFVVWCITGWHSSEQVNNVVAVGVTGVASRHLSGAMASLICDQGLLAGQAANAGVATLAKTSVPVLAKSVAPVVTSTASGMISSALGVGSGVATSVGVSSVAGTAAVGVVGFAGGSVLATVAAPVAAGVAVGYGIKKLVDWIRD